MNRLGSLYGAKCQSNLTYRLQVAGKTLLIPLYLGHDFTARLDQCKQVILRTAYRERCLPNIKDYWVLNSPSGASLKFGIVAANTALKKVRQMSLYKS